MKKCKFYPKEFNKLKFNWNGYVWTNLTNICSPLYPNEWQIDINKIMLNMPEKVLVPKKTKCAVPICITMRVSELRYYKYLDYEYEKFIYISNDKIGEKKSQIWEFGSSNDMFPELKEMYNSIKNNYIEKGRNLNDSELNHGESTLSTITFNLCDYIDIPLENGKYEVFFCFKNLESNHCLTEIEFI